jgi:nucleoside-diphosphate-sugar epimerase
MRALVTGASGFLGNALIRQLCEAGVEVVAAVGPAPSQTESQRIHQLQERQVRIIPCELRQERPLDEVPAEWDTLFHLAAYVQTEQNSQDVHVNDAGTARLLRQLPLANRRVVYTSTLAVADNAPTGLITPATVCQPRTAYGKTKLAAEAIVREACVSNSAAHTIIRMPTLYGPGYRTNGIFDVLPRQLAAKNPFARLAWPGKLALLAVEDAARLVFLAATEPKATDRTFLASSNENPATWEIAEAIALATGAAYRALALPQLATTILRATLGGWWQASVVPYALQIAAWRAHLLLNGLYCDGSELAELLSLTSGDWRRGFCRMYAEDPRHGRTGGSSLDG